MVILIIIEALSDSSSMLVDHIGDNGIWGLFEGGDQGALVEAEDSFTLISSWQHIDNSFIVSVVVLKKLVYTKI